MSALCAIWGTKTHQVETLSDAVRYFSPRAGGVYVVAGSAWRMLEEMDDREKAHLTTWIVDQGILDNAEPKVDCSVLQRLRLVTPLSVTQRRDRLLSAIERATPRLGQTMRYREMHIAPRAEEGKSTRLWVEQYSLMAATESLVLDEVDTLVEFATGQGFIAKKSHSLALTFEGYRHLEELNAIGRDSSQVFVAMWFGAEVSEAYDIGIGPAIIDAGYKPMRIDQKEHNNKIDDEIIAEIRRSRFLIADFMCGLVQNEGTPTAIPRGGVYYEAGFAQGLGIPVIWCCREDHINHVHFDTRQFNHITWKTPEELREKLRNRIGAVLGDGPLRVIR